LTKNNYEVIIDTMNIFYLDKDPKTCAEMHCDKHVVKMIIEYAQLMSTAHRVLDGDQYEGRTANNRRIKRWKHPIPVMEKTLYKASHVNHPSGKWTRDSQNHYNWLYEMWTHLCDEYTHRYGKVHMTDTKLRELLQSSPMQIPVETYVDPYLAMPDDVKQTNVVEAYKNYYINYKKDFAKWTQRPVPEFMKFKTHAGFAS
tara:strand:- start:969 stop:1568 length:600 start_codon:yes stop_codon:yes gene_type:complete